MFNKGRDRASVRADPPPLADIESALEQLRGPEALCFINLTANNQGLCAELSFNTAKSETPSGRLEIGLREATLDVSSSCVGPDWRWNAELLETADEMTSIVEVVNSVNEGVSKGLIDETDARVSGKAKIAALVANLEIGSEVGQKQTSQNSANASRGTQSKVSRIKHHIRVERKTGNFRLEFSAVPYESLVELNTKFNRLPFIDVSSPSELDLKAVTVDLVLPLDLDADAVKHAFHVRRATGAWGQLKDPNRRILAELLISKFLPELHAPQRLWPGNSPS